MSEEKKILRTDNNGDYAGSIKIIVESGSFVPRAKDHVRKLINEEQFKHISH